VARKKKVASADATSSDENKKVATISLVNGEDGCFEHSASVAVKYRINPMTPEPPCNYLFGVYSYGSTASLNEVISLRAPIPDPDPLQDGEDPMYRVTVESRHVPDETECTDFLLVVSLSCVGSAQPQIVATIQFRICPDC
jgi:hypothetical protein